ncbi:neopullulanase [Lachnospiraceae bacterium KM106-2]|nr:neopullulanase [Lachnospiraceae bacterium KM106-2]
MSAWYDHAVFYHIYPFGLCGVPFINDSKEVVHKFKELELWLYHIRNLGCDAIYIGPLFESISHGYDTTDYKKVDRRLGTNSEFADFVSKCHVLGIKVVVDGVFNHIGRKFFAFQDVKRNRENSKFCEWFCQLNFSGNNSYNDEFAYQSWRGCTELVKLNLSNIEVKQYLFDVVRFWVNEFDIDGIRLDCADVLDFTFMKELRTFTDQIKDDFWLLGEVIHGDYSRWVNNSMLHAVTNYELHKGLYSGHNDHNYFEIAHTIKRLFDDNGGLCKGKRLYSFIDNHDVSRIIDKISERAFLKPIYILLYTLPGIPSIYYGSEFLVSGDKNKVGDIGLRPALSLKDYIKKIDSDSRQVIYKNGEYDDIINLIKKLGEIHHNSDALVDGRYQELTLTNRQYSFARILEKEVIIVAVNNDVQDTMMKIPVPVNMTDAEELFTNEKIKITEHSLNVLIGASSGVIIRLK